MSDKKIPRMSEFSDIRGEIFAAADKLLKIPYLPVTRLIRSDPSCLESFGKYRVTVSSPLLIFCLVSVNVFVFMSEEGFILLKPFATF